MHLESTYICEVYTNFSPFVVCLADDIEFNSDAFKDLYITINMLNSHIQSRKHACDMFPVKDAAGVC